MKLNWTTLGDRIPESNTGFTPPFISCIVYSCNPKVKVGGVIETCRWDVKNNEWLRDDIRGNWLLQPPYEITHFVDDVVGPYAL